MTAPAVEVRGATRRFGPTLALDDVSLTVGRGGAVGLLGPNGAGKSTLVSLLTGQRRPDAGTVRVLGADPRSAAVRAGLGTTPQQTGLPATLRVAEVVDLVAGHWRRPVPTGDLLARFGLAELARRQTGGLSGGQQRRLAVALAFVGRPALVLLDEPTTGLDVEGRRELWDAVGSFTAEGGTLLLTSHHLEEVEALADRVVVVDAGRVVADGTVDEVRGRVQRRRVRWREGAEQHEVLAADADGLVRELVGRGAPFRDLEVAPVSLEEAFLSLTARPSAPQPRAAR